MGGKSIKGVGQFNQTNIHVVPKQTDTGLTFEALNTSSQGSVSEPDPGMELGALPIASANVDFPSKNPEEKDFLINTGIDQNNLTVILSAEFLPIAGSAESDARAYALNVKEKSEVLTVLNAFSLLSKNEQTTKFLLDNKTALVKFSKDQSIRIKSLINTLNTSIFALNVKKFSHIPRGTFDGLIATKKQGGLAGSGLIISSDPADVKKNIQEAAAFSPPMAEVLGLKTMADYLFDAGWGEESKKLSSTTLYQQFILELKRSLLTHSPALLPETLGQVEASSSDYDAAYQLKGLFTIDTKLTEEASNYATISRISTGYLLPVSNDGNNIQFYNRAHLMLTSANDQLSIENLTAVENTLDNTYSSFAIINENFSIGQASPSPSKYRRFFNTPGINTSVKISNTNKIVDDPVVIATLLAKEVSYSVTLGNTDIIKNLAARGFIVDENVGVNVGVQKGLKNLNVWDYIIGNNFTKDSLDMSSIANKQVRLLGTPSLDETLLGLSRSKYQLGNNNKNKYCVLTFETNNLPLIDESFDNLTHGAYFYIDSALNTVNFENFDTTRLDSLILDLEKANDSCLLVKQMFSGLPKAADDGIHQLLKDRKGNEDDPVEEIITIADSVFKIYKKFATVNSVGKIVIDQSLRKESLYTKDQGLPYDASALVTASIFKMAASSTGNGDPKHLALRLTLFHILIRELRKLLDSSYTIDYAIYTDQLTDKTFSNANSKQVGLSLDADGTPDINITQWTDATYQGNPIGNLKALIDSLFNTGGIYSFTTPEQALDFLLVYLTEHNDNVESIDKSTVDGKSFIPLREAANIGKGSITSTGTGNEEIAQEAIKNEGVDNIVNIGSYGAKYDYVTAGDDPTVLALLGTAKSYIGYLGTGIDAAPTGLFKTIIDTMFNIVTRQIFDDTNQILANNPVSLAKTRYSGISNGEICWLYFNLICEFFARTIPDTFAGTFTTKIIGDIRFGGYALRLAPADLGDQFFKVNGNKFSSPYIDEFNKDYFNEQIRQANNIDVLDKFVKNALGKLKNFRDNLSSNFGAYLSETKIALNADQGLNPHQRIALANASFSREQLVLSDYILSELVDRFDAKNESESKLRTLPEFKNYPDQFIDYAPFADLDLTSCTTLSPFFKTFAGFLKTKSNNARILSIGMPPRMIRNLIGEPTGYELNAADRARNNIVRLKIYKNDILNTGIVFAPIEYLFEVNRFPTKIVSNWSTLLNFDGLDYKTVPMKYWNGTQIVLHKNFDQAFSDYGDFLSIDERQSIYVNHVYSQIIEEYVNWFTGNRIDESRYTQYAGIGGDYLNNQVKQFNNYLNVTGNKFAIQDLFKARIQNAETEKIIKDLENTVKRYLNNETLFMDINDYKRKILYPKKFDRVFNIIFDPDSFKIMTIDESFRDKYINDKLVAERANLEQPYIWTRDTQQSDIYLEEYWATIEPYDITNEI